MLVLLPVTDLVYLCYLDCFLSPTPYYTGIKTDMGERGQINVVDVHLSFTDNFKLTVEKLNAAHEDLIYQVCCMKRGEIITSNIIRHIIS